MAPVDNRFQGYNANATRFVCIRTTMGQLEFLQNVAEAKEAHGPEGRWIRYGGIAQECAKYEGSVISGGQTSYNRIESRITIINYGARTHWEVNPKVGGLGNPIVFPRSISTAYLTNLAYIWHSLGVFERVWLLLCFFHPTI
jgi:hypothetical protein